MKSKNYWDKTATQSNPFELPQRISKSISACAKRHEASASESPIVKYIWVYVTEEGIRRRDGEPGSALSLDDWLNVIDESASLGAEWMVIYVGASLAQCPEVWSMCEWAQSEHGLRVGIHLASCSLSKDDAERLRDLKHEKTYVVADSHVKESLHYLEDEGIHVCEANIRDDERVSPCTNPEAIACVGIDGKLYTCGLVLGDNAYCLGRVQEDSLNSVMHDKTLPHSVPDTVEYPEHGCDGCPPHMARRILKSLPE